MSVLLNSYEKILFEKLKKGDKTAFSVIFTNYYSDLVHFAWQITKDPGVSEEIVQDVFVKLWEQRKDLIIQKSLKSYLLKCVQNQGIDWKRHLQIRQKYISSKLEPAPLSENETEKFVLHSELEANLNIALTKIPDDYAIAFRMNRFELLSYKEISEKLGVSVRTVEVRISKALNLLKTELKDYFPF